MPYLPTERARRDGWPADSAAAAARPLVLTRPVGAAQVVEKVCPRAAAAGIRPGVTLGQAHALAPGLVALPDDPARDRLVLDRLARWALRLSPQVQAVAPDTLLVDITGCQLLFGGEANIARQAVAGLASQGFEAYAAIADTVGAAWALAITSSPAGAWNASAAVHLAPPGQTSAALAPLPPRGLRIEPHVVERLDQLGVRKIGDLLMLPRAALPARFGSQLVLRLQQALGEVYEGVASLQPDEPPAARTVFEAPIADLRAIRAAAEELLSRIFAQLQRRALALRQLDCVLYYERIPPRVLALGLARASRAQQHVARLLAERLEQVDLTGGQAVDDSASAPCGLDAGRIVSGVQRFDPTPGLTGLLLVARATSRWRPGQGALFEPTEPGADESLGVLIDRLAARLGPGAVLRPRLVDDHQPELAFRYEQESAGIGGQKESRSGTLTRSRRAARTDSAAGERPATAAPDPSQEALARLPRPVRLLARPVPIRAIALVPDGPPTWIACRGREYPLADAAGPERIETGWWRGPDVRRDYFRVTTEQGEQFWIFHDTAARTWFLHGYFA